MTTALIFDVANVIVDWDPIRALEGVVEADRVADLQARQLL